MNLTAANAAWPGLNTEPIVNVFAHRIGADTRIPKKHLFGATDKVVAGDEMNQTGNAGKHFAVKATFRELRQLWFHRAIGFCFRNI
jgi:hypothetical protein